MFTKIGVYLEVKLNVAHQHRYLLSYYSFKKQFFCHKILHLLKSTGETKMAKENNLGNTTDGNFTHWKLFWCGSTLGTNAERRRKCYILFGRSTFHDYALCIHSISCPMYTFYFNPSKCSTQIILFFFDRIQSNYVKIFMN